MSILKLDGDKVLGLNEQLETIKKENDFLFGDVQQPKNTGMSIREVQKAADKTKKRKRMQLSELYLERGMKNNDNND